MHQLNCERSNLNQLIIMSMRAHLTSQQVKDSRNFYRLSYRNTMNISAYSEKET